MTFSIGYCHAGSVRGNFVTSLVRLLRSPLASACEQVIEAPGAYIHVNRNNIVRQFLRGRAEWLLSLDIDMVFTPDDVLTLFKAHQDTAGRILAGLYDTWICGMRMPCWFSSLNPPQAAKYADLPLPLMSCGMGFTAIHREVFEAMDINDAAPWFDHGRMTTLDGVFPMAEDATFCQRATDRGYIIWGVPTVQLGHEKTRVVYPEDE